MIEVARMPGPCRLVRDPVAGLRHLGVPRGGPADRLACTVANALAGNRGNPWTMEFALVAPALMARTTLACAYSGPPLELVLESGGEFRPIRVPGSFTWPEGWMLRGGAFSTGARGYLAVSGGLEPSASALGAVIRVEPGDRFGAREGRCRMRHMAMDFGWSKPLDVLRVVAGHDFTAEMAGPLGGPWTVSSASDRMGIRLEGAPIPLHHATDRLSEPVEPATVQVPGGGLPIVLGGDGQTIGGYPRAAHVIDADLDMLGQLRPGDRFRMRLASLEEACNLAQERLRAHGALVLGIAASGGW